MRCGFTQTLLLPIIKKIKTLDAAEAPYKDGLKSIVEDHAAYAKEALPEAAEHIVVSDFKNGLKANADSLIAYNGIPLIDEFVDNTYSFGKDIAAGQLDRMGFRLTQGEGGPFDERAIDALKTRNLSLLTGVTDEMSKNMTTQISEGMLAGESIRDIAKRLEAVPDTYINRAETIARTETSFAVNTGTINRYREGGVEKVQFLAALDDRTCDECAPLDMAIYSIDEAPIIPVHVNCRCTYISVPEDGSEFEPFTDEELDSFREGNFTPLFRHEPGEEPIVVPEPPVVVPEPVIVPEPIAPTFEPRDISGPGYEQWALTRPETDAVELYQGLGYQQINKYFYDRESLSYLDEDTLKYLENKIADLDSAIDKGVLTESKTLYHGVGVKESKKIMTKVVGDEMEYEGFISSSQSDFTAKGFSAHADVEFLEDGRRLVTKPLAILESQAGETAHRMGNEYEQEILFPRGKKFIVTDITEDLDKSVSHVWIKYIIYTLKPIT
jgi:SPP1 gp7 family putative phage head morphogenesis protein